jgi:hypothetical protein
VNKTFEVPVLEGQFKLKLPSKAAQPFGQQAFQVATAPFGHIRAAQGGQTTNSSEWITLSSGTYDFSLATAGLGSLSAQITVDSKGCFWQKGVQRRLRPSSSTAAMWLHLPFCRYPGQLQLSLPV